MSENEGIKPFQLKSVIVSGTGVFSDSYNLYAISLVYYPLVTIMGLSKVQYSILTGSSYFAAALGAILFGVISDRIGRKPMYGIDLFLIFIGAFSQFFAPNFISMFIGRFIMGFGIGGDYVMSPVIMAENSNTRDRGKLMVMAFSIMFLLGAALSAFVVQVSSAFFSADFAWKFVLGFGAVPSLFVIYYRRKIPETKRFNLRVKGLPDNSNPEESNILPNSDLGVDSVRFRDRFKKSLPLIIVGAVLWVLYDTYASTFTIYGPITIAANLGLSPVEFTYAAIFLAGLPGTLVSTYLIDRTGRKKLVTAGYAGVFAALLLYALLILDPGIFGLTHTGAVNTLVGTAALAGFTFYLINYFFSAVGPATIIGGTVLVPELIPTKIRASGQALNVFIDRMASGLAITGFPILLLSFGLGVILLIYAIIAVGSSIMMFVLLPETRRRSLEEITGEAELGPV